MTPEAAADLNAALKHLLSIERRVDEMKATIDAQAAEIARLTKERDDEYQYGHKLQCALTNVAGGGSENFVKHGDGYRADIPFVVASIQRKKDDTFKSLRNAIIAKDAEIARLRQALAALVTLHENFRASDGNQQSAYYIIAKQYATWDQARAALQEPKT
jgi:hypothetical protein